MDKYCRAGQATDDNMAHAHCMQDYPLPSTHTYNMQRLNCVSTATMVTRTRQNVTLYIHCLSVLLICKFSALRTECYARDCRQGFSYAVCYGLCVPAVCLNVLTVLLYCAMQTSTRQRCVMKHHHGNSAKF
jgi:hypothetical protein